MTVRKDRRQRLIERKQRRLNRKFMRLLILNLLITFMIMSITLIAEASGNNQIEGESKLLTYESEQINDHDVITSPANVSTEIIDITNRNLSESDKYMLAKIAMAEAEGENLEAKIFVILTVLNRVESSQFPDTIEEVIFQSYGGVYQFSPVIPGGRWWTTEPNEECWEAVEIVNETEEDISNGALYFESCSGVSWHSQNLNLICQLDNMRFYS